MSRSLPKNIALIVLLLSACPGCRLWNADLLTFDDSMSVEMLDALRNQLKRDSWRRNSDWSLLEFDDLSQAQLYRGGQYRWEFGSRVVDSVITQLDSVQSTPKGEPVVSTGEDRNSPLPAQPAARSSEAGSTADATPAAEDRRPSATSPGRAEQGWDGFWPLNVAEVLDALDGPGEWSRKRSDAANALGTNYLAELAAEDSLSGWNAAILLAQRDPKAAVRFLPVLERIASSTGEARKQRQIPADQHAASETPSDADRIGGSLVGDDADTPTVSMPSMLVRLTKLLESMEEQSANSVHRKEDTQEDSPLPTRMIDKVLKRFQELELVAKPAEIADETAKISDSMRAAAAEAWCLVLATNSSDPMEGLAQPGHLLQRADLANVVRGELFRGVARRIAPSLIPRLTNALRISNDGKRVPLEVRRGAVDGCLIHVLSERGRDPEKSAVSPGRSRSHPVFESELWPSTVLNCQNDSDPLVRRTFGRWLALVNYSGSTTDPFTVLEAQLEDREPGVRDDALVSLGLLGTESARLKLHEQAERTQEMVRAAAVRGLARWGVDEFAVLAGDSSFKVRMSVAEQLAQFPSARTAILLTDLLTDRDLQVQQAVVESVTDWPDRLALPMLLRGLRDGSRPTRKKAFLQLRRRRSVDEAFIVFDSPRPEERAQAVTALAARIDIPLGYLDRIRDETRHSPQHQNPVRIGDIEADLRVVTNPDIPNSSPRHAIALSRLRQLQPEDVSIIEEYLLSTGDQNAGVLYREVLPKLEPAYLALNQLQEKDLQIRRRAAQRLRELSENRSLSRLVVRRLSPHLDNRQDMLVWQAAMAAVLPDASDENGRVALRALNDERPEVRLLGCQYVLRHPSGRYASWLRQLGLFQDADRRVRLAAIKAAGRGGNPSVIDDLLIETPQPGDGPNQGERRWGLRSLLRDSDVEVRFAAVVSMCHLGDSQGIGELVRLSWHPDTRLRHQAVRAMGETRSSRFIGPLVQRGWTERNSDVRRSILGSLEELTLPGKRPAALVDLTGYDAKIGAWNDWWEQKQRRVASARNPPATPLSNKVGTGTSAVGVMPNRPPVSDL